MTATEAQSADGVAYNTGSRLVRRVRTLYTDNLQYSVTNLAPRWSRPFVIDASTSV